MRGVGSNNCIKLQNAELVFFCFLQTIKNQFFTDMQSTDIFTDSIAGITDVPTSSNIIRMKDIKSKNFVSVRIFCNTGISLFLEKISWQR